MKDDDVVVATSLADDKNLDVINTESQRNQSQEPGQITEKKQPIDSTKDEKAAKK